MQNTAEIRNFKHLKSLVSVVALSGLAACQAISPPPGNSQSLAEQETSGIKREGLADASSEEIAVARAGEVAFEGRQAVLRYAALVVVFKMGSRQPVRNAPASHTFTTDSSYEVRSVSSGRTLAKTASTLSAGLADEMGYKQKLLVSADGSRLLIYETWCDGAGYHDTCALVFKTSGDGEWRVKYLNLPDVGGYEGEPDHGPTPVGFAGEELLFKNLASDRICKKKLDDFEEANSPLPFTIG
ncbi:MAG: hypothetical protein V4689_13655 [Verrucomicrobiota bacterium]